MSRSSLKNTRSFPRSWLFFFIFALSLFSSTVASPLLIARQNQGEPQGQYQLTVQGIILAVILFICGLFFLLWGFRHFRLTMFLVGFYVYATVTWIILANAEPANSYGPARLTIYLVVSLGVGLIAGLFLACCFHLGLWLLGAYGGFVLGLWILAWRSGGVIQARWGQGLFLGLMALAGFLAALFFERAAIIIFTSLIGAYSIIFGLDIFLNTGFIQSAQSFLDAKHNVVYTTNWRVYAMLAGLIALALLGIVIQYAQLRRLGASQPWSARYGRFGGRYYGTRPAAVEPAANTKKRWWFF